MSIPDLTTLSPEEFERVAAQLLSSADEVRNPNELRTMLSRITSITRAYKIRSGIGLPANPCEQATELDAHFVIRPHLSYLAEQISKSVIEVEAGHNQYVCVSLPPRAGKSTLISVHTLVWLLRRHPEWKVILTSYDGGLAVDWSRQVRRAVEDHPELGIEIARDGGAASQWSTIEGGGMFARSVRSGLTGRGARVLVIDDPVKDFVEAHSATQRDNLWNWWLSVAQTRLEPPYLVLVVMTRWHEDDFIGRLLSAEYEGDPNAWHQLSIPALAEEDDLLGRGPGEPLLSPLLNETASQAISRWDEVHTAVGGYTWSAMYQQHPSPAKGAIFDTGWWRFWSWDPAKATEDGRVVHLDPSSLKTGRWLDSWDTTFTGGPSSDYVVGQRWVRHGANRYLVAQVRGRWSFTQTLHRLEAWALTDEPHISPCGNLVHQRLVEHSANGAAAIDSLRSKIAGIKPIKVGAGRSKEVRARAVTPEIESGNVYLPHPSDPGNEWVADLLSELRAFPFDAHDDQVDALTQALAELRGSWRGSVTVPGRTSGGPRRVDPGTVTRAAHTDLNRRRG